MQQHACLKFMRPVFFQIRLTLVDQTTVNQVGHSECIGCDRCYKKIPKSNIFSNGTDAGFCALKADYIKSLGLARPDEFPEKIEKKLK